MSESPCAAEQHAPQRLSRGGFRLWIDGVGGYLVCTGDRVVIGQPSTDEIDIPLWGDVSRRHATIVREADQYLLETDRPARVAGRTVAHRARLAKDHLIELGRDVRLRFAQPHPLSATARLDFASAHGTQPRADAILLFADTCVLGPAATSHIVCSGWGAEVILYRDARGLHLRSTEPFQIDGAAPLQRGTLTNSSHVAGRGWSFSLEPVTERISHPAVST